MRRLLMEQLETRSLLSADLAVYGCGLDSSSVEFNAQAAHHAAPRPIRHTGEFFAARPRGMGSGEGEAPPAMERSSHSDSRPSPQPHSRSNSPPPPLGVRPDTPSGRPPASSPQGQRDAPEALVPIPLSSSSNSPATFVSGSQLFLVEQRVPSATAATDAVLQAEFSAPRTVAAIVVIEQRAPGSTQSAAASGQLDVSEFLGSTSRRGPSPVQESLPLAATSSTPQRVAFPILQQSDSSLSLSAREQTDRAQFESQRKSEQASFFGPQGSKLRSQQGFALQQPRIADARQSVVDDLHQRRALGENVQQLNELLDLLTETHTQSPSSQDHVARGSHESATSARARLDPAAMSANRELPFSGMIAISLPESELIRELSGAQPEVDQIAAWTSRIGILRSGEFVPTDQDQTSNGLFGEVGLAPIRTRPQGSTELSTIRLRPVIASATAVLGGVFMAARRLQAKAKREQERLEQL